MDLQQIFSTIYEALQQSQWLVVFGASLVVLSWLAQKLSSGLAKKFGLKSLSEWFKTKIGKYVVSFGTSLFMVVGTSFMAGEGLSWGLISTGLGAAFAAGGKLEGLFDVMHAVMKKLGKDEKDKEGEQDS